jgi:hypothetical protein
VRFYRIRKECYPHNIVGSISLIGRVNNGSVLPNAADAAEWLTLVQRSPISDYGSKWDYYLWAIVTVLLDRIFFDAQANPILSVEPRNNPGAQSR